MGVVLPGYLDEALDLIGVSWPNVDEDDYREMATAMREFAEDIADGAAEAHNAVQRLVSASGGGMATEALNAHWGKVKDTHLSNLADAGRLTATALDGVAMLIEGAKLAAIVQLGILAVEIASAVASAPFTLGLSALGGLAATQATRMIVKRIFQEVCQQVAEEVINIAMGPVYEALGSMAGDLVVQLGSNALGVQDGVNLSQTAKAGKDGLKHGADGSPKMELLSVGGSSSSGGGGDTGGSAGGGFHFDPDEYDKLSTSLNSVGSGFRDRAGGKITRARGHHGRTRGKDPIADAANAMLDKVIDGIQDASKTATKHLDDNMRRGLKKMADNHRDNDTKTADHFNTLGKNDKKDPASPNSTGSGAKSPRTPNDGNARRQLDNDPRGPARTDGAVRDCGDPVDVATGRVFLRQTDLTLPGVLPLVFRRKFESSYRAGHWLGPTWSSTADQRLEIDAKGVIFVHEDGLLLAYPHPGPGEPVLPAEGPRWPLERAVDGGYTITDPAAGHTRHFGTPGGDGTAPLEEISDRNGNWITFDYDESGTPTDIVHGAGYHLRITTEDGRITALHLVGGAPDGTDQLVIRYHHDPEGNLSETINSSGLPTRFDYDTAGRITSWTDTNGSRYDYVYDEHNRCIHQGGAEGHLRYSYHYGPTDPETGQRITAATNSLGHTTRYTINAALQVIAETDPNGAVTRTERDRYDRPLSTTDPLGRTTRYTYNAAGRLTAVIRPDGLQATAHYNELGLPTAITAADGATWHQEFDERGNRTALTDPTGGTTRYSYNAHGHPTAVTDALGNSTSIECDSAGLPVTITDPLGAVTRYRRDAFGRTTSITDPLGKTTHLTWTVEGQLTGRIDPSGATQSWTYDGEGNCTTHTDALGGVSTFEYTHFDQLAARTGPDGVRYEFTHDSELRLTQVTSPQGLTWAYEYDPAGRLISETDFDNRTLSYTHDIAGQLTSRTNALGQTIRYAHGILGQVEEKTADGLITTYQHDAAGRLLHATGPDASLTYHRDPVGRITSETLNGRSITFAYDAMGRRTRRTTPTGATSTWAYDAAGRRTELTASGRTLTFQHDEAGREIARHVGETLTLDHAWDATGRLTAQTVNGRTGALQHRAYTYRADGHLAGIDDQLNGPRTFDLDAAGRVTAVNAHGWTERYVYDEAGNQTDASWPDQHVSAGARGPRTYTGTRITHAGSIRYEHDTQGRVTLRQKTRLSRKPDTWRYAWDAEDRLTTVTTPDHQTWRYLYDPLGRRTAKQRLAADGERVLEQVDFTWDGVTLTEQTTSSPESAASITVTWDHNGLHPIAQTERKSLADTPQEEIDQRFFAIVTDLVGTPTELVDEAGTIAWRTRTTLWGTTTWATDSTAYTPLRFPGQYFDPETGLHYNFHRYYDPETARYTTPDPLGLDPAPNPATYVDNPHTWVDPLGLAPCPGAGERAEAAIAQRHGGVPVPQGYMFPSRRAAHQAASEMVGDMGSETRAIRARDFRGGPRWMKDSDMVIGRQSADGERYWRDDFLGHEFKDHTVPPHVNIHGPGLNKRTHLFY